MESQQLETGKEWQPFELVSIAGEGGGQAATSDTLTIAAAQLKIVSSVCVGPHSKRSKLGGRGFTRPARKVQLHGDIPRLGAKRPPLYTANRLERYV